jgi:hypothetical protein
MAYAFLANLGHFIFKIFWPSIVSSIAALCVEISPHKGLLTRAQLSIKDAVGSGAGPWVPHVQGVEKVSEHGTKNLDKRRSSVGKL